MDVEFKCQENIVCVRVKSKQQMQDFLRQIMYLAHSDTCISGQIKCNLL